MSSFNQENHYGLRKRFRKCVFELLHRCASEVKQSLSWHVSEVEAPLLCHVTTLNSFSLCSHSMCNSGLLDDKKKGNPVKTIMSSFKGATETV